MPYRSNTTDLNLVYLELQNKNKLTKTKFEAKNTFFIMENKQENTCTFKNGCRISLDVNYFETTCKSWLKPATLTECIVTKNRYHHQKQLKHSSNDSYSRKLLL